ncbi:MAG TPA: hypothetical protein VFP58_03195 [Candidatus Eisenbacteria bacterium]|nr:hypothetical protein [Candidatus Eisenbacteria bacterium]
MSRSNWFPPLAVLAFLLVAVAPARADEKAKGLRVAIMPVLNSSPEVGAPKIMLDILRDRLKEVPAERATFLYPADTERLLSDREATERGDVLLNTWSDYGTLDSTAAAGLDEIVMSDALLFVKITEWENTRVNTIGRGESNTTVGLQFALFDLKSGKKTWWREPREQRFAQEIDVSSGTVNYDETGYIQSRNVTDPPRYEDVAADLVRSAFKNFPQQKQKK